MADANDREAFKDLLDRSAEALRANIASVAALGSDEFEHHVCRVMQECAVGTVFDESVQGTKDKAFPDIVIGNYFGVEVKRKTTGGTKTTGNSIFEGTREENVQEIYLLIGIGNGSETEIYVARYEDAIESIVVTHSPRFQINIDVENSLFRKMGISYKEFSELTVEKKMERVKDLYKESSGKGKDLWWLNIVERELEYKFFDSLSQEEKMALVVKTLFLFPELFGDSLDKYDGARIFFLAKGILVSNIRDLFSSGGKVEIDGEMWPRKLSKAIDHEVEIVDYAETVSASEASASWELDPPLAEDATRDVKIRKWRGLVAIFAGGKLPDSFFSEWK